MKYYYFYKLYCIDENVKEIYVGNTINIKNRLYGHEWSCKNINGNTKTKLYKFIRANGGWKNWLMEIIEEGEYENGNEACKREDFFRINLNATLNSCGCWSAWSPKKPKQPYIPQMISSEEQSKRDERIKNGLIKWQKRLYNTRNHPLLGDIWANHIEKLNKGMGGFNWNILYRMLKDDGKQDIIDALIETDGYGKKSYNSSWHSKSDYGL